ncbi:MAG: sigma-70 family RNA polymerase sigma factor [Desulfobacterales bacterium]|nr:sigma-70 family RNA polymerase sigma factor [Desulfobacterales bacterium]
MKKLTPEQEDTLLYECITNKNCDKLVRQYWNLVYDKVRKTFHFKHAPMDQADIEEAHQNVFVRLFDYDSRLLKEFDRKKGRSLTGWIVLIAGHTTLNYLRKKSFDSLCEQTGESELAEDRESEDREPQLTDKISINEAVKKLPQADRIVIKLHLFGLSSKEIAYITDSTPGAVDTRITRIREKMREFLK